MELCICGVVYLLTCWVVELLMYGGVELYDCVVVYLRSCDVVELCICEFVALLSYVFV